MAEVLVRGIPVVASDPPVSEAGGDAPVYLRGGGCRISSMTRVGGWSPDLYTKCGAGRR